MNCCRPALLLILAFAGMPALAQTPEEIGVERARIAAERQKAESQFAAREQACYGKFAVNDCIAAAQAVRRQALADLRRQEVGLNGLERKRRAAERMRELEERQAEQRARHGGEAAAKAQADARERQQRAADKAARPAPQGRATQQQEPARPAPQGRPRQAQEPQADAPVDVEGNRRRHEERVRQVEEHKAKALARAEKKQKKAAPLPVPPEAAAPPAAVSPPAAPASR